MIFGILFLSLKNADVKFIEKELIWKTYSVREVLPITKQIQLINGKKFVIVVLDPGKRAFLIHVADLQSKMSIHQAWKAKIALLLAKKVTIPNEYLDFADAFEKRVSCKAIPIF